MFVSVFLCLFVLMTKMICGLYCAISYSRVLTLYTLIHSSISFGTMGIGQSTVYIKLKFAYKDDNTLFLS